MLEKMLKSWEGKKVRLTYEKYNDEGELMDMRKVFKDLKNRYSKERIYNHRRRKDNKHK